MKRFILAFVIIMSLTITPAFAQFVYDFDYQRIVSPDQSVDQSIKVGYEASVGDSIGSAVVVTEVVNVRYDVPTEPVYNGTQYVDLHGFTHLVVDRPLDAEYTEYLTAKYGYASVTWE